MFKMMGRMSPHNLCPELALEILSEGFKTQQIILDLELASLIQRTGSLS